MKKNGKGEEKDDGLRREAEKTLAESLMKEEFVALENETIIHELKVHQIELEMQNNELRQAQFALEEMRDRFRFLYDFAPVGYFTLDEKLKIRDVNVNGAAILGRSKADLYRRTFRDLIEPMDLGKWTRHINEVLLAGRELDCELALGRADGGLSHVHIRSIAAEAKDGKKEVRMAILDIGDRWRAEMVARTANRKMQMMAAITRHDMRNEIIALRGCLELAERTEDPKEAHKMRMSADAAAKNIEAIAQFTKEYEGLGVHAPQWTEVGSAIERNCSTGQTDLTIKNEVEDIWVLADPLIGKVFYNLMENCLRHGRRATFLRFTAHVNLGTMQIVCEDDGIGIPQENKEAIFERGFGSNTGLGLFFAREILAITDITIVENGFPEVGARFMISVPSRNWQDRCPPGNLRRIGE